MSSSKFLLCIGLMLLTLFFLSLFQHPEDSCQRLNNLDLQPQTTQAIMVEPLSKTGIRAQLSTCIRKKGYWQSSLFINSIPAVVGKKGIAPLGTKKEGDSKTPEGLYPITWAFGSKPLALKMDYRYITTEDKFIDDPKDKNYNKWVHGTTNAKSFEPMLIPFYKYGAVINYNMGPIIPGSGSAIFIHIWQSDHQGTAGCVALSEKNLLNLLHWLDKQQHPYIYIAN